MIKNLAVKAIKSYQFFVSPLLGRHCRFYPSCSQYMLLAIKKYGFFGGAKKGTIRICKCHPFNAGGVDLP